MKNKNAWWKRQDCNLIVSCTPRKIRWLNRHQKYIDNAMISTKKMMIIMTSQKQKLLKYKQAINNSEGRNLDILIDSIFGAK